MARRSEHSLDQIKEMVLNAAETIIVENGAQALTVRKVALEIGYTVGSIYMVFANMQDVLLHIKARTLDRLAAELQGAAGEGDVEGRIRALAQCYSRFAAANINLWRIVFEPASLENETAPDWFEDKIETIFTPIENLFQELRPGSDRAQARHAARTLWCGVHGVCMLALNGNLGRAGGENQEAAVNLLVDSFIRGWKSE